ncbi:hypothetical protein Syun_019051 [Stephania yunnanensis]|uniref:Uncharacterized protein n=1 Tax=Stephania yunnanensis TaxID=152371 RepID=A0AAP0NWY2_9MAGN
MLSFPLRAFFPFNVLSISLVVLSLSCLSQFPLSTALSLSFSFMSFFIMFTVHGYGLHSGEEEREHGELIMAMMEVPFTN